MHSQGENPALAGAASLPAEPGSYALVLQLGRPRTLQVGRLGTAWFQAGFYIYLGSAHGPGGLQARLDRHMKAAGAQHWHVDYLRRCSQVTAIYYLTNSIYQQLPAIQLSERLECCWSQALANIKGSSYPMPRFGASDCQMGCPAHLVRFDCVPVLLPECLAQAAGVPDQSLRGVMV